MLLLVSLRPAAAQETQQAAPERPGTAEIRGVITLSAKGESEGNRVTDLLKERYSSHGSQESMVMAGQPPAAVWKISERAVVYLEASSPEPQAYHIPERHSVLDQRNLEFHPRVLPILVGSTVDFPNRDELFHNVFSYSQTKEFDLGRYPKNDSRSVTFDRPGVVRVYCDIHSHMNATILVLQNPYFAVPTEGGSYTLRHIPQGKYSLVFWCDRDVVERRPIELKAGETLEVNLTF